PNAGNWRRSSALGTNSNVAINNSTNGNQTGTATTNTAATEISYESLYSNLPVTEEKLKISNDSIQQALFASGSIYLNGFDDCSSMTETYLKLQERFPSFVRMDEVLFNLYYCNQSSGNTKAASQLKQKLIATYPNSRLTTIATTGKDPSANQVNPAATAAYEKIYDQFI